MQAAVVIPVRDLFLTLAAASKHVVEVPHGIAWDVLIEDVGIRSWRMGRSLPKVTPRRRYIACCGVERRNRPHGQSTR